VTLFVRDRGRGTLAPWSPTSELVVAGPYRVVRNPMITGVATDPGRRGAVLSLVGDRDRARRLRAVTRSTSRSSRRPGLRRRFGADYEEYAPTFRVGFRGCALMLLYDSPVSGNCYKVRLLLAHLGIPYERQTVDVVDRSNRRELLGHLNPGLTVPTLVLDDGRPLGESAAISGTSARGRGSFRIMRTHALRSSSGCSSSSTSSSRRSQSCASGSRTRAVRRSSSRSGRRR
jgi:hypothetical protein